MSIPDELITNIIGLSGGGQDLGDIEEIATYVRKLMAVDTALLQSREEENNMLLSQALWVSRSLELNFAPFTETYSLREFSEIASMVINVANISLINLCVTIIPLHIVSIDRPRAEYKYKILRTSGGNLTTTGAMLGVTRLQITIAVEYVNDDEVKITLTRILARGSVEATFINEDTISMYDIWQLNIMTYSQEYFSGVNSSFRNALRVQKLIITTRIGTTYQIPQVTEEILNAGDDSGYTQSSTLPLTDYEIVHECTVSEEQPDETEVSCVHLAVHEILTTRTVVKNNEIFDVMKDAMRNKLFNSAYDLGLQMQAGIYAAHSRITIEEIRQSENITGITAELLDNDVSLSDLLSSTIRYVDREYEQSNQIVNLSIPNVLLNSKSVLNENVSATTGYLTKGIAPFDILMYNSITNDYSYNENGDVFIPFTSDGQYCILELEYIKEVSDDYVDRTPASLAKSTWMSGTALDYVTIEELGKRYSVKTPFIRRSDDPIIGMKIGTSVITVKFKRLWIELQGAQLDMIDTEGSYEIEILWGRQHFITNSNAFASGTIVIDGKSVKCLGMAIEKEGTITIDKDTMMIHILADVIERERDAEFTDTTPVTFSISEVEEQLNGSRLMIGCLLASKIQYAVSLSLSDVDFIRSIGTNDKGSYAYTFTQGNKTTLFATQFPNVVGTLDTKMSIGKAFHIHGILMQFSYKISGRIPVAPGVLNISLYGNTYMSETAIKLNSLSDKVSNQEVQIADIIDKIDYLQKELEALKKENEGTWWKDLLWAIGSIVIDIILPGLGPALMAAAKTAAKVIKNAIGYVSRVASALLTNLPRLKIILKMQANSGLPSLGIVMYNFAREVLLNISDAWKIIKQKIKGMSTPIYQNKGTDGTSFNGYVHIDVGEKLQLISNARFRFTDAVDLNNISLKDLQNRIVTNGHITKATFLPKVTAHYEPLSVLPSVIAKPLHRITTKGNTRHAYAYDTTQVSIRQPSHAFAVVMDYEVLGLSLIHI